MNFFGFKQDEEALPGDIDDIDNIPLSLNSGEQRSVCMDRIGNGKGQQIEVNSQVSSVVRLDEDSNDAESITFQLANTDNNAKGHNKTSSIGNKPPSLRNNRSQILMQNQSSCGVSILQLSKDESIM